MLLSLDKHRGTGVSQLKESKVSVSKALATLPEWQHGLANSKICHREAAKIVWGRYRSAGQGVLHNALHLRLDVVVPQALLGAAGIQVI